MEQNQIEQLIALNASKLPPYCLPALRDRLAMMDFSTASIYLSQLKDPTIALVFSVCLGGLGIDRFYVGDIGLGVLKLVTGGGCGIWWIIDLFFIMNRTREVNYRSILSMPMGWQG